jgi:hypothetical protein
VIATEYKTVTKTETQKHTVQPAVVTGLKAANTRLAPIPTPMPVTVSWSTAIPRTTSVQFIHEEVVEEEPVVPEEVVVEEVVEPVTQVKVTRNRGPPPPRNPPSKQQQQRWW